MSVLSAASIRGLCVGVELPLLSPFAERTVDPASGTTYGLGPCTYDVRIKQRMVLKPGGFALASTIERFIVPLICCGTVMDKSSLARRGLTVQNTHLDPGWQGWLTLELANHGVEKIVLAPGQPIAQIKFEWTDAPCQSYSGKYQNQPDEVVAAIAERSAP